MPDEYLDWMRESDAADQWQEASERRERFANHNSTDWERPRKRAARPYNETAAEAKHAHRQAAAASNRQQIRQALEEHGRQRTLSLFRSQEASR